MELQLVFEKNLKLWRVGYCTEFAALGMASLVIGPAHFQFSCDADRDDLCKALGSLSTAFRAWLTERLSFNRSPAPATI